MNKLTYSLVAIGFSFSTCAAFAAATPDNKDDGSAIGTSETKQLQQQQQTGEWSRSAGAADTRSDPNRSDTGTTNTRSDTAPNRSDTGTANTRSDTAPNRSEMGSDKSMQKGNVHGRGEMKKMDADNNGFVTKEEFLSYKEQEFSRMKQAEGGQGVKY